MTIINNFIHGEIVKSNSSEEIEVFDPSKGEVINKVCCSDAIDINRIIESSKKGFEEWSSYTPLKRSRVIFKFKNIIEENMVFTVEPGIYLENWGGVRIEDIVLIKDGETKILSNAKKNKIID